MRSLSSLIINLARPIFRGISKRAGVRLLGEVRGHIIQLSVVNGMRVYSLVEKVLVNGTISTSHRSHNKDVLLIGVLATNPTHTGHGYGQLLCEYLMDEVGLILDSGYMMSDGAVAVWDKLISRGYEARMVEIDSDRPCSEYPTIESASEAIREDGQNPNTTILLSRAPMF